MSTASATGPAPRPIGERDVEEIRRDFPGLGATVHGRPLVYLDNAATTQVPAGVIEAMSAYYGAGTATVHRALHHLAGEATRRFEEVRVATAAFIGAAAPEEIVFTRGATESINLAAAGWGRRHLRAGDAVLLTEMEHHSNLVPWQILARERGLELRFVPVLPDGTLDLEAFRRRLDGRVKLLAVTETSNVLGTVNPVRALAEAAHDAGARVLVDAAQSVPHRPVSVRDLDCDFMVFSAHKMAGPTGVGVLYGRRACLEEMDPLLVGGGMIDRVTREAATWTGLPGRFEAGTPNISGVIAFGAALAYLSRWGMGRLHAREQALCAYAMERLTAVPGLTVFGRAPNRSGTISFRVEGIHPHDVAQFLDQEGIAIRSGQMCAQPLMRRFGVPTVNRASLFVYNTAAEIDRLAAAIEGAAAYFGHGT